MGGKAGRLRTRPFTIAEEVVAWAREGRMLMVCPVPFTHVKGHDEGMGNPGATFRVAWNEGVSPYRMMGLKGPVGMVTLFCVMLVVTTCASLLPACMVHRA